MKPENFNLFTVFFILWSPVFQRVFNGSDFLYSFFVFVPILFLIRRKIYRKMVVPALFIVCLTFINPGLENPEFLMRVVLGLCPFVFLYGKPFRRLNNIGFAFLVVPVIYGMFQNSFGYLPFELEWINNRSTVRNGFIIYEDIRVFSFFSGLPEFTLFSAVLLYFSVRQRRYLIGSLAFFGMFIGGSRGIILGTVFSFFRSLYKHQVTSSKVIGLPRVMWTVFFGMCVIFFLKRLYSSF